MLGLPCRERDPIRPLAVRPVRLIDELVSRGLNPALATKLSRLIWKYRMTKAYTKACAADDAVAVDLFTGEPAGPPTERQRADARARLEQPK